MGPRPLFRTIRSCFVESFGVQKAQFSSFLQVASFSFVAKEPLFDELVGIEWLFRSGVMVFRRTPGLCVCVRTSNDDGK